MKYQSEYETNEKLSILFNRFNALKDLSVFQIKEIKQKYERNIQFYGPVIKELLNL